MDPQRGAVRELVPEGRLDSRAKLIDLLTQVIFTAGPGHAAQHFSSNYYHRFSPAFPVAAYAPPPWPPEHAHAARFLNTLPPIRIASNQVRYNTFTNLKYDQFGHYDRYRLGKIRIPEVRRAIAKLRDDLAEVEREIRKQEKTRLLPYDFLLPCNVPNSVNI